MFLEIAVFNPQSALIAAKLGADRLELCSAYQEGGLTPSLGMLTWAVESLSLPVFPIVRPHAQGFDYDEESFWVMKKDIALIKKLGFAGCVLGILNPDKTVDIQRTTALVELAYPMEVTFHKAFDETIDMEQALEDVIECGCSAVLTSAGAPKAVDGIAMLEKLMTKADHRIEMIAGGSIRSDDMQNLKKIHSLKSIHSACITDKASGIISEEAMLALKKAII